MTAWGGSILDADGGSIFNADLHAGDDVSGRSPHGSVKRFRPYAKHYLAMNETPYIDDPTHGMMRRIYIIEFQRTFSIQEMDTQLTGKLLEELPGIFNWALVGYRRLKSNSFKFSEAKSVEKAKGIYQDSIDSVGAFIKLFLKSSGSEKDMVIFKHLYQAYSDFCHDEGYIDVKGKKELKEQLLRLGFVIKNSTTESNQLCVYGVIWLRNLTALEVD